MNTNKHDTKDSKEMQNLYKEIMADAFSRPITSASLSPTSVTVIGRLYEPTTSLDEVARRIRADRLVRARSLEQKKEDDKIRLLDILGEEEVFRFSYVPFVLCELIWDFADSVIDIAILEKVYATRRLSGRVKQLYNDYRRRHDRLMGADAYKGERRNMYVYQEGVKSILSTHQINLECDLTEQYPDLSDDFLFLLVGVYQCYALARALMVYCKWQEEKVSKIVGHRVGNLVPKQVVELSRIILEYVGDKPASPRFLELQETYIKTLATQMALVNLCKIKEDAV